MIISLDNFDQHGRSRPVLNSPRSLQACRRQGIEPQQLLIRTLEQIKKIYKDGINDKKSVQIKLQHYEMRRKNKLNLVRQERIDIMSNLKPIYRPNHAFKAQKVEIIQVQDKLQKKRLMDEVKAELKQKQLEIKEMKIEKKIENLTLKKKEEKNKKQQEKIEQEKLCKINKIKNQIQNETKINNYFQTQKEKQQKIQQILMQKHYNIEKLKLQKQKYYEQKAKYIKQLQTTTLNFKKQKVYNKFNQLQERIKNKESDLINYKKNLQMQRIKDEQWKETKKREAQLQEKKRQGHIWQSLKYKDIKKQELLQEIQGKKSRYFNNKKLDRQTKESLIKNKQLQDERQIQKRRRILQLIQEDQQKKLQSQKQRQKYEIQNRVKQNVQRQNQRRQMLRQQQKEKQLNNKYILQKEKDKQIQIDKLKRQRQEKEREKILIKEIKIKETEENRLRKQKIQKYQKMKELQKYNDKMSQIQAEKNKVKNIKVIRSVSRDQVQSKIVSDHSQQRKKAKHQFNATSEQKINNIKAQAKKNPIQAKQTMKKEEIAKLIQNLKIQCNKQEYVLMKEEQNVQKQREQLQKTAQNIAELRRLQKIHGVQRARFQQKLTTLMKANQEKVERYKIQFFK